MNAKSPQWLLLVTNLPGQNQTLRMRIWRALKAAGAGLLRDGAYVLPQTPDSRQVFDEQAREIRAAVQSLRGARACERPGCRSAGPQVVLTTEKPREAAKRYLAFATAATPMIARIPRTISEGSGQRQRTHPRAPMTRAART